MPKNRLITTIPKEEQERLSPFLDHVDLELKQILVEMNRPIRYVYFPDNAVTSTVVETLDGGTIEVGLMGIEGMVGLSLLLGIEKSNTTVFVQIPGSATRMKASDFVEHVRGRGGPLFIMLLRYSHAFMGMIAQVAACNNQHSLEERMARWILLTHDRVRKDEFLMTHEFLSQMLGVRRPSVSVVASTLQNAGIIRYSRGNVTVVDRKALEAASCECYEIITRMMESIFEVERS
ncbi:MAG TPA: Crp/Fnr family transcriptional regulator [Blastocatellia bacterium]|nr:Crp/Fnr family transcriptional regulator [Blastocatellia bacterium]